MVQREGTAEALLDHLAAYHAPTVEKWLDHGET